MFSGGNGGLMEEIGGEMEEIGGETEELKIRWRRNGGLVYFGSSGISN